MTDTFEVPRRRVRREGEERKAAAYRAEYEKVLADGMYPLDAPFMPPPGPDFLREAAMLGDGSFHKQKTVKKTKVVEQFIGEELIHLYRQALRTPLFEMKVETKPSIYKQAVFVPGHIWGQHFEAYAASLQQGSDTPVPAVDGPHPAEVMVIGKMPWKEEVNAGRNFVGPTGEELLKAIKLAHIKGHDRWYITNIVKFMPPDEGSVLRSKWIADCLPLLHQELRIVRPRYILCLGADASKLLLGKKFGVGYMEGRVIPFSYHVNATADMPAQQLTAQVMTVVHPAQVSRDRVEGRRLERGVQRFKQLVEGTDFSRAEDDLDHRVCTSLEEAEQTFMEAALWLKDNDSKLVAWDAEWQGQHPMNDGAYMRTVQMAWKEKTAVCFKLYHAGGEVAFRDRHNKPAIKRLMKLMNEFMKGKRAVGHFLVSDLEWLEHYGFNLSESFKVPLRPSADGTPAWARCMNGEGGFDTAMAAHAIEETAQLGLEFLASRYTTAPRYDIPLHDWKERYCKEQNIKPAALEGYGDCPDEILIPYANYDSDVTLRIANALIKLLSFDYYEQNCWEAFWESMIIQPTILEIHQTGILVDRNRVDELTDNFVTARANVESEVKRAANWPDFNIRSTQHVKEHLFGYKLNGKVTEDGRPKRIRPHGARSLRIQPLLTTGKPPQRWTDIVAQGKEREATPSTAKGVLAVLAQDNPQCTGEIMKIRDYRFLDQALKSVLRPPETDEKGIVRLLDDDGFYVYEAGLVYYIDADGRVRPHMYPTAETARWKCSRPNLQNISKARDADYERLLGKDNYKHKMRSMLCSPSALAYRLRQALKTMKRAERDKEIDRYAKKLGIDGKARAGLLKDADAPIPGEDEVFIDFDFKGAELYGMAIMSGDDAMIEHAQRNINFADEGYDENGAALEGGKFAHPDYYDIHSNVAVFAFKLTCPPTKYGLKAIGKAHLRIVAKSVIFGIAYGRGAKAIALAAREQGVSITVDEAQQVIDSIFELYPGLQPFFAECSKRALEDKWLCSCYGRFRRFPYANDFKLEGEFERQAMNFPIQSMIASCLDRGVAELFLARDKMTRKYGECPFRFALTVHDAVLLQAKAKYVDELARKGGVIEKTMCKKHPIYTTTLDGMPTGKGPYYLGIDVEISEEWSAPMSKDRCAELGIPASYGK